MIKRYAAYFLLVGLALMANNCVIAQAPAKTTLKPIIKFKPPIVKTFLGNMTGSSAMANVTEAKSLISLPLNVTDSKNESYHVSSYQFTYKRIGITEDEETGKTSPETDMVSRHFEVTPLAEVWQTNIAEFLHPGETLYFFDIIVLDKQGRRFFAPTLKITVQ